MGEEKMVKKVGRTRAGHVNVQIGKRRKTDVTVPIKVSGSLLSRLTALADGDGVVKISEDNFRQAMEDMLPKEIDPQMVDTMPPSPINILEKANEIIYGDREKAYGSPRFNLDTIAMLWTVYLQRKFSGSEMFIDLKLRAEDVSQLMILLKTARLIHNPTHVDSLVDQAGYAALQNRIQDQ